MAACLAPAFAVVLKSYDVWSHLATGRWIVEHRSLPHTDPFTYTMQGKPWRLVNGLADVILYGFQRLAGDAGVVAAKVVFAWLTLTLLGLALAELRLRRSLVLSLMVLAAALLQARYSLARPLILGASLCAAGLWAAVRVQAGRGRGGLWFFGLALPLWPLVHGTALVGMAQLGVLALACHLLKERVGLRRAALGTLLSSLALSLVLPWWRDLYAVALGLGSSSSAVELTAEWASGLATAADHPGHWLVIAVGLASGAWSWRRQPLALGLALFGAALALRFGRNAYEGVLLSLPAMGLGLEALATRLERHGRLLPVLAGPALSLAIALGQLAAAPRLTVSRPFGFGVARERFPYDTLKTLERLPVARLLNDFPLGGFLIWRSGPWGVYCDGRTVALYAEEDVRRLFLPLLDSAESLTRAADSWHAVYGLTQHLSHPNQWMMVSPEWVPLHLGTGTTLFVRRTFVSQLPADVVPLSLLRYTSVGDWNAGWYRGIAQDPSLRAQLEEQMREAVRLGADSPILPAIVDTAAAVDEALGRELGAIVAAGQG